MYILKRQIKKTGFAGFLICIIFDMIFLETYIFVKLFKKYKHYIKNELKKSKYGVKIYLVLVF